MKQLNQAIRTLLDEIEYEMRTCELWQDKPPHAKAFLSQNPFALDTMEATEWLQWIFLPKMRHLIGENGHIPRNFLLYPYFEEALKARDELTSLLALINQLDELVKE